MVVVAASRVERSSAKQTSIPRTQVLRDSQLQPTIATEHSFLYIVFCLWPYFVFVSSETLMAGDTGVVITAALVLDGNDV